MTHDRHAAPRELGAGDRRSARCHRPPIGDHRGLTAFDAGASNLKRENANINGDSSMGTMLQYGSAVAKGGFDTGHGHLREPQDIMS